MHVLWKIKDARFGLLTQNHVKSGAQVLSFSDWLKFCEAMQHHMSFGTLVIITRGQFCKAESVLTLD